MSPRFARSWMLPALAGLMLVAVGCGEESPSDCVPDTCEGLGLECGVHDAGCGETLICGECADGFDCSEEGFCEPSCTPRDCESLGVECGSHDDSCGVMIFCGDCPDGHDCEAGECVCVPETCESLEVECGEHADECGGTVDCGGCPGGYDCDDGECVCVPETCESLEVECGEHADECGGTVDCGGCPDGHDCEGGLCVDNPCLPNPCTNPPGAACDGEGAGILVYEDLGSCSLVAGEAECEYDYTVEVCEESSVCDGDDVIIATGSCIIDGGAPVCEEIVSPCGDDEYCAAGECHPLCGNDIIDPGEVCDGDDLGGMTCDDFPGLTGAGLACSIDCQSFDTSGCDTLCATGPIDVNLGSDVGAAVSTGTTEGESDDYQASCGGGATGADVAHLWTPPGDGCYVIDTDGSDYDTVLHVASCATGEELACNDDAPGIGLLSRVSMQMTASESYIIVVDGFGSASGDYVLNIEEDPCACVTCDEPPADQCSVDDTETITYSSTGTCIVDGGVAYCEYEEITAACDVPPSDHCSTDGSAVVTYTDDGFCVEDGGSVFCDYEETETLCDDPPPGECDDGVLTYYEALGTCGGSPPSCSYATGTEDCAANQEVCTPSGCSAVDEGHHCVNPAVAGLGTTSLAGTFEDELPSGTFSCVSSVPNIAWFELTPEVTGEYELTAQNSTTTNAWSRLVVLEGSSCYPHGPEVLCETAASKTISERVILEEDETYIIAFFTDGVSWTMVDPELTVELILPGDSCEEAVEIGAGTTSLEGDYSSEDIDFSCQSFANSVWYELTPEVSGTYEITAENATSMNSYSRLAVLQGGQCDPLGDEIVCGTHWSTAITETVDLEAGQTYLVVFGTDGEYWAMEDPTITVTTGGSCETPALPGLGDTELAGEIESETIGFSCASASNSVWYEYTATHSGDHVITVDNSALGSWSRLVVLEGTSCDPYGAELFCGTQSNTSPMTRTVSLEAGQAYLIVFGTDGETWDMIDPSISIRTGEACEGPVEVSTGTTSLSGTFESPSQSFSCTVASNMVWYELTPSETGVHEIVAQNHTDDFSFSRLVVLEGSTCDPYGAELLCGTESSQSITGSVALQAGQTYLIVFGTDGENWEMLDPDLTIFAP